jgi:hypothetical protein
MRGAYTVCFSFCVFSRPLAWSSHRLSSSWSDGRARHLGEGGCQQRADHVGAAAPVAGLADGGRAPAAMKAGCGWGARLHSHGSAANRGRRDSVPREGERCYVGVGIGAWPGRPPSTR